MGDLQVSDVGLCLIKSSEGLRLKAYHLDGERFWTIGYGHNGPDVHKGLVITAARADQLLRKDLADTEQAVNRLVRVPLTQGQFDALVSFAYNVGVGAFASSTLLKRVNEQQWKRATAEFGRWVLDGSRKPSAGLVARRAREARLFWTSRPKPKKKRTLRAILTAKARLGRFDPRMCLYYAAPTNVNDPCKAFICRGYAAGLVPTFTTNGQHSEHSYHTPIGNPPTGRAVDLGLRRELLGTTKGQRRLEEFQRREHAKFHAGRRRHMIELLGPVNTLAVLADHETDLVEGTLLENQHDNHVHGAFE